MEEPEVSTNVNDRQVGGSHYRDGAGKCPHCGVELQHWDIVHMFGLDYYFGVATKYIFRFGRKGDPAEQIEKAIHYLQKKLEIIRATPKPPESAAVPFEYVPFEYVQMDENDGAHRG